MKVWITRDTCDIGYVDIWGDRPYLDHGIHWRHDEDGEMVIWNRNEGAAKEFKKRFGFTPRKGSCKQYELELKEIK